MGVLNQALVNGVHVVVRTVEYHARQVATPGPDITSSVVSPLPSSTSTIPFSSTSTTLPPSTPPGDTNNNNEQGSRDGAGSPLLFFVALGFGVVFTNLWIIVGVKYCFRYNARNRQLRGLDENGEPINLDNMPARPHRRRREKKLMTMDEVNEKFPMMKYKAWVAARASEGLPTAGGISAPPSRANSVRSVEGVASEISPKRHDSDEDHPNAPATSRPTDEEKPKPNATNRDPQTRENGDATSTDNPLTQAKTVESVLTKDPDRRASIDDDDDDDDDEHIDAALPPELLGTQGDTCAICIDTLEDDDDVRGLTCGHAFHAVCIDPWLTNRRASCPLCKADYYTPKPRPPPAEGDPTSPTSPGADPSRNDGRVNMPRSPQRTLTSWSNFRGMPRGTASDSVNQARPPRIWQRNRPGPRQQQRAEPAPQPAQADNGSFFSRVRSRLPPFRRNGGLPGGRGNEAPRASEVTASGANGGANTTPSQLEAGVRPSPNAATS
ncbi:hypothetical protein GGS23DRAFT_459127 [Durotheca rogersii]|uniref:uncharacterized protein n=1 Tax=Durotheca rogersii TaxID=419775 RepID=UPI00221FCCC7|nr:uncharacterized protein GGS23DRAFT_459127 [Durotheca rogersii]KAI5864680.1 hypothetical protein GGS23DRAFT_459127 [Durotheca rogersii]